MITATVQSVEGSIIKVKALDNIYELDSFFGCGLEVNPEPGERVVMFRSGGNTYAIGGVSDIDTITDSGERRYYSLSDGVVSAQILLKNNGDIELNDADTEAVRYQELLEEINKLKSTLNNLVSSHNSHIHTTTATVSATAVPGVISPTTSQATSNSSDFTKMKSSNVKLS